ncbi:Fur family ferric uptake transcriptional regulator [Agromyces terreus]|uniref:Fur family ferric uptake transcriptional regulator n=1 Tax=Agromyces terreus TaxID=424795 RepID=A0A9X2GZZ8_9MICO|nr:Fur family transcriptional regulator [Agromyces terreus]MCP2370641.1 Fur family ferric uptake transcriptional regulator [Agromyces terreus]
MTTDEIRAAAAEHLRSAGLRVTEPRLAVLEAVTGNGHLDADTVHTRVAVGHPGISLQSVYNVLGDLSAAELLRRIEPAGSPALFESRIGDNHHHIVCTRCSAVADVDCIVGQAPCLAPSDASGFVVHTAEVTFWGLCASCQQEAGV